MNDADFGEPALDGNAPVPSKPGDILSIGGKREGGDLRPPQFGPSLRVALSSPTCTTLPRLHPPLSSCSQTTSDPTSGIPSLVLPTELGTNPFAAAGPRPPAGIEIASPGVAGRPDILLAKLTDEVCLSLRG